MVIGLIAFASAVLGANREIASQAFAIGFILIVIAITINGLQASPIGIKLGAIGFDIAAIPSAIGGFFLHKSDSDLAIFFYLGTFIMVFGIVLHGWSIITKRN